MPQAAAPPRPRVVCLQTVRTFGRWDCINARQRERAKESRFAACTSLLTSPATRRPPPKCGAFRLQPQGSLLRQTGCWSEEDSNSRSHRERNETCQGCTTALARENLSSSQFKFRKQPRFDAGRSAEGSTEPDATLTRFSPRNAHDEPGRPGATSARVIVDKLIARRSAFH